MDLADRSLADRGDGVLTAGGRRVGYLVRGPQHGVPVVHLHGVPGSRREQFVFPEPALERFGIRMVSVDRAGWGNTEPLAGGRIARSADVLAVCDALGIESFPLLAVSGGGSYALTLAATAPERVTRVVLVSAQMPYDDEDAIRDLEPDQLRMLPALQRGRRDALMAGFTQARAQLLHDPLSVFSSSAGALSARERRWLDQSDVREVFAADVREGLRAGADGMLDDLLAWPHGFEVGLGDISCPVIAVHGDRDTWEPIGNLRRVLAALSDSQLIVLEGMNHLGPLLHSDLVLSLVEGRGGGDSAVDEVRR